MAEIKGTALRLLREWSEAIESGGLIVSEVNCWVGEKAITTDDDAFETFEPSGEREIRIACWDKDKSPQYLLDKIAEREG